MRHVESKRSIRGSSKMTSSARGGVPVLMKIDDFNLEGVKGHGVIIQVMEFSGEKGFVDIVIWRHLG